MEVKDLATKYLQMQSEFDTKYNALKKKIEKYNRLLGKAEKDKNKLLEKRYTWVSFINDAMKEVANKLQLDFSDCRTTFGLRCECPLFLNDKEGEAVYGITFTRSSNNDELTYDDCKKVVDFNSNSIASLNGFGNSQSTIKINDLTTDKLIEILKEIKANQKQSENK